MTRKKAAVCFRGFVTYISPSKTSAFQDGFLPMLNGRHAATRRRALAVLADNSDGCTEAIMLAHGFTAELLVELVQEGLASVSTERKEVREPLEVIRFKITDAGRRALQ
jgi:hypothetical protein